VVLRLQGREWHTLLSIDTQLRNDDGYIGIDFIDPAYKNGLALSIEDARSDGTKGFTLLLNWLDDSLQTEGTAVEIAWNPKVHRFQEYAPNELDPPDFKPEVPNPPVRKR